MRRLKPATGLWKIPHWVVIPGKQTTYMGYGDHKPDTKDKYSNDHNGLLFALFHARRVNIYTAY
jgi:hypothetical protein